MNRFGSFGAALGALAIGSFCLGAPAVVVSTLGLGFLANTNVGLPLLYGTLGVALGATYISFRHNRRPLPLILAPLGAGMVLYPLHLSTDIWLFRLLIYGGLALLVTSSLWRISSHDRDVSTDTDSTGRPA